jgi:hypothetical protein
MFIDFGMEAFAERARIELAATGEHARKRTVDTRGDLTPQEHQISRRVMTSFDVERGSIDSAAFR